MSALNNIELYTQEDICSIKQLNSNKITVCLLNNDKCDEILAKSDEILSRTEKLYVQRFVRSIDKIRSSLPRLALHYIISNCFGIPQSEISVQKRKSGQPYIEFLPEIKISISHSGRFSVVAISTNRKVGIDIEKVKPVPEYLMIAERFFCKEEFKIIKEANDSYIFYQYWTAKEAFVKAIGEGLRRSFDSFYVDCKNMTIYDKKASKSFWHLNQIEISDPYVISCVFSDSEEEVNR